jgi:hypothetical protein
MYGLPISMTLLPCRQGHRRQLQGARAPGPDAPLHLTPWLLPPLQPQPPPTLDVARLCPQHQVATKYNSAQPDAVPCTALRLPALSTCTTDVARVHENTSSCGLKKALQSHIVLLPQQAIGGPSGPHPRRRRC